VALTPDGRIVVANWGPESSLKVETAPAHWVEAKYYPGQDPDTKWRGNIQSLNFLSDGTFVTGTYNPNQVYVGALSGGKKPVLNTASQLEAMAIDAKDQIWVSYRDHYAGRIALSKDKGHTFEYPAVPNRSVVRFLVTNKQGTLIAMGANGEASLTTDSGQTWRVLDIPQMGVSGVLLTDSGYLLIASGYDGILRSRVPVDQL
jgi:hypothetical protein